MRHLPIHGLAILSVITLTSCGEITDLSGPESTELPLRSVLNLDVAMVSADALIEDMAELQLDFIGIIGGAYAASAAPVEATSPPLLKRVREVTYYDTAGNEQDAYDGVTTASVHIVSEISGERARGNWYSSIARTRAITVTGLAGTEVIRTANGIGSSTRSRSYHSDENGDRSYEMSGTSVITDVVRPVPKEENNPFVPREEHLYPLSGTITRDVTVVIINGRNGNETRTKHVVITFNGTQFVTMTVDGEAMEVDLSARKGRDPLRRRGGNGPPQPPICRGNGPPPTPGGGGIRPPPSPGRGGDVLVHPHPPSGPPQPPICRGNGSPPPPQVTG